MYLNNPELLADMDSQPKTPRHIAVILDGNRRYAKKKGLEPWKGHEAGAEKVRDLLKWCQEFGVKELTLYTFSTENFNRSKIEVEFLMNLLKREFNRLKDGKEIHENKVRINVIGNYGLFSKDVQQIFKEIMEKTKDYDNYILNFALGYGSREEITQAVKKIADKAVKGEIGIEDIDENLISRNLYLKNEPDLLIRHGGEKRISNFLLWQLSYAEFIFLDKLLPEMTKEDFRQCIEEFGRRQRRFGE